MKRRDFLLNLSGVAAAALFPRLAAADSWITDFSIGRKRHPYLAAYAGSGEEMLATPALALEGKLPAALRGTLYRNGPARLERGGLRYHHWFDGDGMVQAFRFSDNGVSHTGRMVRTEKYAAESRAGKFLRPAFGTVFPGMEATTHADALNVANTNVIPHSGELLALWEGGSAYALDAATLETLGPKVWRADLKGMPFSAHPKIDADGTLWNFGLDPISSTLVLYRISPRGAVLKAEAFQLPNLAMVHDFAITAHHLIFLLPPFQFDQARLASGASFLDCHRWLPAAPLRILTVAKDDWSQRRIVEMDNGFVFHLGNAWEDEAGVIRFDYVRYDDATIMTHNIPNRMRGTAAETPLARTWLVTLDARRQRVTQQPLPGEVEFPRVDPRHVGLRYRQLFNVSRTRSSGALFFNAVVRRELETGKTDAFDYGSGFVAEEHLFVPRPASKQEGDGWLIGSAFDVRRNITVLSVFDALHLSAGPIARASLPYALPLGLHGSFAPA